MPLCDCVMFSIKFYAGIWSHWFRLSYRKATHNRWIGGVWVWSCSNVSWATPLSTQKTPLTPAERSCTIHGRCEFRKNTVFLGTPKASFSGSYVGRNGAWTLREWKSTHFSMAFLGTTFGNIQLSQNQIFIFGMYLRNI